MAEGLSVATANAILAAIFRQTSFTYTAVWVKLHVGPPGADGTANEATNTERKDATACFGTAPAGGSIVNTVQIGPWASVPADETYSHVTLWTASTAGTFIGSGTITTAAVSIGDSFAVPAGDVTASFPTAA